MIALAIILAVALAGALVVIGVGWRRSNQQAKNLEVAWGEREAERAGRLDVARVLDAERGRVAKAEAEVEQLRDRNRNQAAVILAARAEFAEMLKRMQAAATDEQAIQIVDELVARRLN